MSRVDLSRWRTVALLASVGLNLFFAGMMLSRPSHPYGPPGPPDPERFVADLTRGMAEADAAIVRAAFKAHEPVIRNLRDRGGARRRISDAIAAEPFDAAALGRVMEEVDAERDARDTEFRRMILEAVTKLSPEGRRQIARFEPGPPGGPPGPPPRP